MQAKLEMSCPSWARGLKSRGVCPTCWSNVVPLVGTWIEIADQGRRHDGNHVVPLVGTWIEIAYLCTAWSIYSRAPRGHVD